MLSALGAACIVPHRAALCRIVPHCAVRLPLCAKYCVLRACCSGCPLRAASALRVLRLLHVLRTVRCAVRSACFVLLAVLIARDMRLP